ncbi:hypothetical protein BY458DRAFT_521436 [Sporodiniella umbellata]|nr:hypothetical protein BY458DRAFT_521436 [Sporodiniella umbellata]
MFRTEDGDDVSKNFERALQSMGAKTRRVFSDSCTHLIFKNGSPATVKKALSRNAHIINLLWISRCKKEGKRLAEEDFAIERPQTLVLSSKKKRKSMEPCKVKALGGRTEESGGPSEDLYELRNQRLEEERRKTMSTLTLKRRHEELLESTLEQENTEHKLKPRLSLPVEALVGRHESMKRFKTASVAPSPEMKEHIKARFSIGNKVEEEVKDCLLPSASISSSSSQSTQAPIRRKRRLTGSGVPKQNSIDHIPSPSSTPALIPYVPTPNVKQNTLFSRLTTDKSAK